jgi:predicted GH43/DUF377 family glycosyl hydrolase
MAVSNPALAVVDGDTVLLCRVEGRDGSSHLTVTGSANGVHGWRVDHIPLVTGRPGWGVKDPRVTWVAPNGTRPE